MILTLLHDWIQDLRHGLRLLSKSKGLAFGVVVSMGLGIGATASIFSLVDFIRSRPLPVPQTNRVVHIANSSPTNFDEGFSYPEYREYLERSHSFAGIATYQVSMLGLAINSTDAPRVTLGMFVSSSLFSALELKPVVGRGFIPEEDSVPGRDAVALISHREWQRDFGGAADVVGRAITVNGFRFTVVGVMPADFLGVMPVMEPQVYIPRMMLQQVFPSGGDASPLTDRSARAANLLARLKPGVTAEQAKEDIGRIAGQLQQEHPETNKDLKATLWTQTAYRQQQKAGNPGMAILLFSVAFLVLGIACVNVSNLLLSTAPARTREMAVRTAMGAPRSRLLQQLLIESIMLSSAGTLAGLVLASGCARFVSSIRIGAFEWLHLQPRIDERVIIFALFVGLISAFMSGAIPAWRCSRSDLNSLLKSSDPKGRPRRTWGQQMLVAVQVAVTSLVLVFSGLFLKDLQLAGTQNPGFRLDHVLTMSFNPSTAGYDLAKSRGFYDTLLQRFRVMPGVKSLAIAQDKPFGLVNNGSANLKIEGYEMPANQQAIVVRTSFVSEGYFQTLDIPIIRGRAFDRRDVEKAPRTVIINEAMSERYWANRDPIGARVEFQGDGGGVAEVIGVARNSKYGGMNERPQSLLYQSYAQSDETMAALFVETDGPPEALTSSIQAEVRRIDPNMPVFDVNTMQAQFRDSGLFETRFTAQIFSAVGAVGLVLGILGLYAVVAYSVAQRTYEIGIRMAVGASAWQVLRMVLLQGLTSSGIAAAVGVGFAFAVSGMTENMVFYVKPQDPLIYVGVLLLMLFCTGFACYVPARRASMVDPNVTLRS